MALTKTTDLGNGYSAEYFRIVRMVTDMDADTCTILVNLYKDSSTRTSGWVVKSYQYQCDRSVIFDKEAPTVDNPLHAAYEYLKGLDFYSGAVDS